MSRDLTVNKWSLGNSRPSFLVATATIAFSNELHKQITNMSSCLSLIPGDGYQRVKTATNFNGSLP